MSKFQRKNFTLLELAAVIAILILLTAVSGVYIGRERKMPVFERSLRDFQVFCAKGRSDTMRDGIVRKVVFYPEENLFRMEKVDPMGESEAVIPAEEVEEGNMPYVVLDAIDADWEAEQKLKNASDEAPMPEDEYETVREWKFPEKLGVTVELPDMQGVEFTEESLEMWRFTRNGAARLTHALTVQLNSDIRTITVSDFTGLVEIVKTDTAEGQIVL
ncbi:MAG: hypothetical protein IKA65_07475 [Lentisphaeria bacterium]|nr:hypothetical protein [Lentisphaeria bacterium]